MKKPLWHRLSSTYRTRFIKRNSGMLVSTFMDKFRQPGWCNYPGALGGGMGCWSLITDIRCKKDCGRCDMIKRNKNEADKV